MVNDHLKTSRVERSKMKADILINLLAKLAGMGKAVEAVDAALVADAAMGPPETTPPELPEQADAAMGPPETTPPELPEQADAAMGPPETTPPELPEQADAAMGPPGTTPPDLPSETPSFDEATGLPVIAMDNTPDEFPGGNEDSEANNILDFIF